MENIGPVVLFLLYMVISAWAKQKKNKRHQERADHYTEEGDSQPPSKVESIFEQLKQELFEEEQEEILPPFFNEAKIHQGRHDNLEPETLVVEEEVVPEVPFVEGSSSLDDDDLEETLYQQLEVETSPDAKGRGLEEVLKSYSIVQQGIILHEILGKPRAMQENDDWFHSH